MKAAVLYNSKESPVYTDFPEPVPENDQQLLVSVKAVALKHFDKNRDKGTHYSSQSQKHKAKVIGGDGVCLLADGTRVYALGVTGMMAEKAVIEKNTMVNLPEGLDDGIAAALPNAVFGAAMALRFRAAIEPGDTVLINGATGFTGRVAVQIAKHYGAGRIIATGRNTSSLQDLPNLGADEILSLQQTDSAIFNRLQEIHVSTPVHVVIDYLWGHTAECILAALKGNGSFSPRTRFVSVGAVTGDTIQLSAANLRSIDLQLSGSGLGSWTRQQIATLFSEILPEMFQLAADGKLKTDIQQLPLSGIENLWEVEVPNGKRLVVRI